jgi:hypothetical protein
MQSGEDSNAKIDGFSSEIEQEKLAWFISATLSWQVNNWICSAGRIRSVSAAPDSPLASGAAARISDSERSTDSWLSYCSIRTSFPRWFSIYFQIFDAGARLLYFPHAPRLDRFVHSAWMPSSLLSRRAI